MRNERFFQFSSVREAGHVGGLLALGLATILSTSAHAKAPPPPPQPYGCTAPQLLMTTSAPFTWYQVRALFDDQVLITQMVFLFPQAEFIYDLQTGTQTLLRDGAGVPFVGASDMAGRFIAGINSTGTELRLHDMGPDGVPSTADDVTSTIDTASLIFTEPTVQWTGNGSATWIAYNEFLTNEVHYCGTSASSAGTCAAGQTSTYVPINSQSPISAFGGPGTQLFWSASNGLGADSYIWDPYTNTERSFPNEEITDVVSAMLYASYDGSQTHVRLATNPTIQISSTVAETNGDANAQFNVHATSSSLVYMGRLNQAGELKVSRVGAPLMADWLVDTNAGSFAMDYETIVYTTGGPNVSNVWRTTCNL